MLDALPASRSDEVDPQCNLWIFREPWIQRGAARNQRAVEPEQRLSRQRIPPMLSRPPRVIGTRKRSAPTQAGVMEFWSSEFRKNITPLLHYSIIPALAARGQQRCAGDRPFHSTQFQSVRVCLGGELCRETPDVVVADSASLPLPCPRRSIRSPHVEIFAVTVRSRAGGRPVAPWNAPLHCDAKLFPQPTIVPRELLVPAALLRDRLKANSELARLAPEDADPKAAARSPLPPGYAPL